MATSVPNTSTFSEKDVVSVVAGTGLKAAFTNSVDAYFDATYKGSKNRLSNFRNYHSYIDTLSIGNSYGGGIIAYIYVSGDAGYVSGAVHGIICANTDGSFGLNWAPTSHTIITYTGLTYGTTNTNNIVSYYGSGSYAARNCYDLSSGGYSDWILPSKDELNKLYLLSNMGYGGFDLSGTYSSLYWSSSQYDSADAWVQSFTTGVQTIRNNIAGVSIRAIRYF